MRRPPENRVSAAGAGVPGEDDAVIEVLPFPPKNLADKRSI